MTQHSCSSKRSGNAYGFCRRWLWPESYYSCAPEVPSNTKKSKARGKAKAKAVEVDADDVETPKKPKLKRKAAERAESDLEVEVVGVKKVRRKGAAQDSTGKAGDNSGDDASRGQDSEVGDVIKPKPKPKPKRPKAAPSRTGGAQSKRPVVDDDEDDGQPAKKKKRKINIFGPAQESTFAWGQIAQTDNGLNIPTVLSPVKESEAVPSRSNSSILGRMSSVLAGSFRR